MMAADRNRRQARREATEAMERVRAARESKISEIRSLLQVRGGGTPLQMDALAAAAALQCRCCR